MDPLSLLRRETSGDLTPEEEATLASALSAAYHMDEAAATSRDVQRIAEKVRACLNGLSEAVNDSSAPDSP
ncbi:MAG: hypothetical protein WD342_16210 [Verrucomicrobiales bacterium]